MDNIKEMVTLISTGGPAVTAALFLWCWWNEKKENRALQKELLALSVSQVRASTKMEAAMIALKDVIDRLMQ